MSTRPPVRRKIEREVFQQFSSQCAFCGQADLSTLQLHHIEPYAVVKAHDPENLILVCGNCHLRIEAGEITQAAVYRKKIEAVSRAPRERSGSSSGMSVIDTVNNGIIASEIKELKIQVKGAKRLSLPAPSGTIAQDRDQRNYAKHLIDRYHAFKEKEVGKAQMKHAVLYASINRKFGAKWDLIPSSRFPELVRFLQQRIDQTIVGKNNKARGEKNYSTYQEYLVKYQ